MNDYKVAEYDYLEAKSALKKDLIVFLVLSIISILCFTIFMFLNSPFTFSDCLLSLLVGVITGIQVPCILIGLILGFKFAWSTFEGWSLLLLFLVFGISISIGFVLTAIKFIKGYLDIRKLGKQLYGAS